MIDRWKTRKLLWSFKGGGGGSSTGQISYPAYMETFHATLLSDIDGVVTAVIGANPYTGVSAPVPDTPLTNMDTGVTNFNTVVDAMSHVSDWQTAATAVDTLVNSTLITAPTLNAATDIGNAYIDPTFDADTDIATAYKDPVFSADTDISGAFLDPASNARDDIITDFMWPDPAADTEIDDAVDAYEDIVDDHVTNDVLPRFKAGLRDINAVMSSSFVLGQSNIEGMADRDVAKFQGELRVAAYMQKDSIKAKTIEQRNTLISSAHIEDDKINASSKELENKLIAEAHLQEDRIDAEGYFLENKLVAQAHLQEDDISAKSKLLENQLVGEAHLVGDRSASDLEKSRRLMSVQFTDKALSMLATRVEFEKSVAHYTIEANRLRIVAKAEEADANLIIDDAEGKWDLDVTTYSGNMLASIGGGVSGGASTPNKQSALGGALSGAATGAMVGANPALMAATGGWSLAIGAALGGIGGLLG